ncbi:hypothetical protein [Crinalium epipsammum]|nr:hypothetical protein [Crinalium epipsammum]
MIQTFCLAQQNAGEWEWIPDYAGWSVDFDTMVQMSDDGFEVEIDGVVTPVQTLKQLKELTGH